MMIAVKITRKPNKRPKAVEQSLDSPSRLAKSCCYFPFENSMTLHSNKIEFPLPKDALYQV